MIVSTLTSNLFSLKYSFTSSVYANFSLKNAPLFLIFFSIVLFHSLILYLYLSLKYLPGSIFLFSFFNSFFNLVHSRDLSREFLVGSSQNGKFLSKKFGRFVNNPLSKTIFEIPNFSFKSNLIFSEVLLNLFYLSIHSQIFNFKLFTEIFLMLLL